MSLITIQCRLVASEETRRYLWLLMANQYTALINELLKQIARDSNFENWCQQGKIALEIVKEYCSQLKEKSQFSGLPGRFYASAIALTHRIYKSWLALQKQLRNQIAGQTRWFAILQSDDELITKCNSDLNALRTRAAEILGQIESSATQNTDSQPEKVSEAKKSTKPRKASRKKKPVVKNEPKQMSLSSRLFKLYDETTESLTQCAIAYLIKNGRKLPDQSEDPKKFAKRRRKTEIRLERLTRTLQRTRLPAGRDLSWDNWLKVLAEATTSVPQNEDEAADWQANLLTEAKSLPFPVSYETNEDLSWFLNEQNRLCVSFNGLAEHTFEIYCDQRQLHWFKRFFEDQQIKKASSNQRSASLFTLRSGRIAWQVGKGQGSPWKIHQLVLFCTLETDAWTQEGTEKIRQKKASECAKVIASTKAKGDLNPNQEKFIQRRETMLALLDNPFPRPSCPLYQGQPTILAGISYGLDKPATLAIVDVQTGKAITYRSIRQLLGEDYPLLNRHRLRQQRNAHQRHNRQRKSASSQLQESNLGAHIDRLIAGAIVAIAQKYQVSSLVLPDFSNIREIMQSEVQTRAEQKILGYVELQRQYAVQYRASVHRWSYARLSQYIQNRADQVGIAIETAKQPFGGTPQEKAKQLIITAYQSRNL